MGKLLLHTPLFYFQTLIFKVKYTHGEKHV